MVLVNNTELSYHASPMYSNHGDKGWYGIEGEDEDGMRKPGRGATRSCRRRAVREVVRRAENQESRRETAAMNTAPPYHLTWPLGD